MTELDLGPILPLHKGEYSADVAYEVLNRVEYNLATYEAIKDVPLGTSIQDTSFWIKIFDSKTISKKEQIRDVGTSVAAVDMHFDVLLGCGWKVGEIGGDVTYASSLIPKGARTATITASTKPIPNQLVVYISEGFYYTNVVETVENDTVTFLDQFIGDVLPSNLFNGWVNKAHLTDVGYYALADYSLRASMDSWSRVDSFNVRGATEQQFIDETKFPANNVAGQKLTSADVDTYHTTYLHMKVAGEYKIQLHSDKSCEIIVQYVDSNGVSTVLATEIFTNKSLKTKSLTFQIFNANTDYSISIKGFEGDMIASPIYLSRRLAGGIGNKDAGVIVTLGDSWDAFGTRQKRYEKTLPNVTVINAGIGGNTSYALVARMAEALKDKPSFCHIMVGTNDVYSGTSSNLFNLQVSKILTYCKENGIKPILFTPFVGDNEELQRFHRSREYAVNSLAWNSVPYSDLYEWNRFSFSFHQEQWQEDFYHFGKKDKSSKFELKDVIFTHTATVHERNGIMHTPTDDNTIITVPTGHNNTLEAVVDSQLDKYISVYFKNGSDTARWVHGVGYVKEIKKT